MKEYIIGMGMFIISLITLCALFWFISASVVGIRYDCRALHGGWHPDVPLEVQKQCREQP